MKTIEKNKRSYQDKTKLSSAQGFSELIKLDKSIRNLDFIVPWQMMEIKKKREVLK